MNGQFEVLMLIQGVHYEDTWLDDAGKYYQCTVAAGCSGNTACIEGGECPSYKYDTWVTMVPELKNFFANSAPQPLRLAQLMGMPPEAATAGHALERKYMLELWVAPQDLFRPYPMFTGTAGNPVGSRKLTLNFAGSSLTPPVPKPRKLSAKRECQFSWPYDSLGSGC